MNRVKVSSRHQIAVPSAVRKALGIESGDFLCVEIRNGSVVLTPEPRDVTDYLRGLHSDVWQGVDPNEYVRQERSAWRDSNRS
jgi:AbrB family looped-hinge helix DNA binding protein